MNIRWIVLLSVFLSACVSAEPTYLPDGSVGYHISCDGQMHSMGDCYQKAGEICGPQGYRIEGSGSEVSPMTSVSDGPNGYYQQSGNIITRSLSIRCGK